LSLVELERERSVFGLLGSVFGDKDREIGWGWASKQVSSSIRVGFEISFR
jgi:hypothetical protein